MQEDSATLALNPLVVCGRQCHVMHYSCHARWCHDMRMSFIIQKSMKTNMYLQGRIEVDAALCECLTDFRNITEQKFGGSFASFVTLLCNSGESDALSLLYLNLTEEIYKMGHSCLGVLCNAELTVHFWPNSGIKAHQANQTRSRPPAG